MTSNPSPPARRWLAWAVSAVLLVAGGVFAAGLWSGCRQYPPASSPEALSAIRLLNTACNTRDEKRLAEVEKRIAALAAEGKMTSAERDGFDRVIGWARAGEWARAEAAAFRMAQDQVGVGHPAPEHPQATTPTQRKR